MKEKKKINLHGSVVIRENGRYTGQDASAEESEIFLAYMRSDKIRTPGGNDTVRSSARPLKTQVAAVRRIDLERGMPTVQEAIRTMEIAIQNARASGVKTLKLVHGYGSTGRGGSIRVGVQERLREMKRYGVISEAIPGEEFGSFGTAARRAADLYPLLIRDHDWGKYNQGITIVLL